MRIFDKIAVLALCAALLPLASCKKDNPKAGTVKAKCYQYFEATPSVDKVNADASVVILDIKANVPWTIKADEGLIPEATEGSGSASVQIAVPENTSFDGRSFSYSVSTEAELDVDDPVQWTVIGRTLDFGLMQDGALPKISVDPLEQTVPSSAESASVDLNANIGYQIECLTEGLSYRMEDDLLLPTLHHLVFSFPANPTANPVEYRAEIRPEAAFASKVSTITVVIRQSALKVFHLDCTDATRFRYSADDTALKTRTSSIYNTVKAAFDFYIEQDGVKYPFYGQVSAWALSGGTACLSNKSSTTVRLPHIEGYILKEVEVTYSHSTTMITYSVTDDASGKHVLGSCNRVRSTSETTKIDLSAAEPASDERYLKASREMCVKFILTYIGVE